MDRRPVEGPGGRPFAGRWRVWAAAGAAAELLARTVALDAPAVWILEFDRPALVLGSTQPSIDADIDVVRRRSGGGAVLLRPESVLWVDVVVPAGDPRWEADVGRAFWWLGEVWAAAIGPGATVHRGPLVRTPWSDRVCFAGLGPGEVTVAGRKVVGISQRRGRQGALLQCAGLVRWDYEDTARLLRVPPENLAPVAAAIDIDRAALTHAFLDALGAF